MFTSHAKDEMLGEDFGIIHETEVKECIQSGEIIKEYKDDKPYESMLIYGRTKKGRPLHVVCALIEEKDRLIVITTYEPDPNIWINYRRRK